LASLLVFELGLNRTEVRVPSILRNLIQGVAAALLLLWMWREATSDLFSLVTTSTVLAVLGFALQGTIANLFAGLSLQLDPAFHLGEWIKFGDVEGKILEVRWRNVLLQNRDGDVIILPNSDLLSQRVDHLGGPRDVHRLAVDVGFHYRHPPNTVKQVMVEAALRTPGVLATPAPDCLLTGFADSSVTYQLRFWVNDVEGENVIASNVRTRMWYAARRADLEIPYPIRTVVHPDVQDGVREAEIARHADALAGVELFASLDAEDRLRLAQGMREAHFGDGEPIIRQGDPGDSCYLIAHGEVSVRLGVDGMERELKRLRAGELFGDMSLVTGEPRNATCVALGDVACRVVDRAAFRRVLDARPALAERISATLAARQTELEAEREGLSAAARARRERETQSTLLRRIRAVFNLG
jgi:CRP-like cAMP-binding protein